MKLPKKTPFHLLTSDITAKTAKPLMVYLLFLSVLELLAYRKGGVFSIFASRLWLATAIASFLLFLASAFRTFYMDLKNKNLLLLLGFFLLLALFCSRIGNLAYSDVSYEAALQTAAGLDSFSAPDFNYTGVAFLNYANRQYVINAIPALLFGRSIFTLHLGFALPFLTGITLLYLELRAWLRRSNIREEYALLPLYALPVFPFITEYFMNFEQTLTPVSYTMLGLALLLRFYRKQDSIGVITLSFLGGMCCNAYTPVLAFFGFLVVFLVLWSIEKLLGIMKHQSPQKAFICLKSLFTSANQNTLCQIVLCFTLVVQLCCYFLATLVTEQKGMITTAKPDSSILAHLPSALFSFFTDQDALFFGIWLLPVLGYLFLSLLGVLKFHDFLVSCWMLATVFFSSFLAGYTTYEKAHEIQRNMLIIPVFVTAFFFAALRFFKKHPVSLPKTVVPTALLVLLFLGQFNFSREHHSFVYFRYIQPLKYMLAYSDEVLAEQDMPDTAEFNLVLHTDNPFLGNLSDYTAFFYPNARTYVISDSTLPEALDSSLPTFVFSEQPEALSAFHCNGEISSREFENKRYNATVRWYYLSFSLTPL